MERRSGSTRDYPSRRRSRMIARRIVKIHRLLDEAKAEHVGIKPEIAPRGPGDRRDVMNTSVHACRSMRIMRAACRAASAIRSERARSAIAAGRSPQSPPCVWPNSICERACLPAQARAGRGPSDFRRATSAAGGGKPSPSFRGPRQPGVDATRRPSLPPVWLEAGPRRFWGGRPVKIIRFGVGAERFARLLQDDYRSADRHAVVKVDDVVIEQADAPDGNRCPDWLYLYRGTS